MSATAAPAHPNGSSNVARTAYVMVIALLVQFVLGLAASLWVAIGRVKPWSHITNPVIFAVHGLLGVAITVMAFVVLGRAQRNSGTVRLWASVAVAGTLVALICGLKFVSNGSGAVWSLCMGLGWAAALLANVSLARE